VNPAPPRPLLRPLTPPLNVVLVEPLIPQNTGNIARLCVGTGSVLHLVRPLGFDISAKAVRRAGLDYWEHLTLKVHDDWEALGVALGPGTRRIGTSKGAQRAHTAMAYRPGDALVFGKETTGLSPEIVADLGDSMVAVPRFGPVRSLNLGNTVAVVLYEALRQLTGGFDTFGGAAP